MNPIDPAAPSPTPGFAPIAPEGAINGAPLDVAGFEALLARLIPSIETPTGERSPSLSVDPANPPAETDEPSGKKATSEDVPAISWTLLAFPPAAPPPLLSEKVEPEAPEASKEIDGASVVPSPDPSSAFGGFENPMVASDAKAVPDPTDPAGSISAPASKSLWREKTVPMAGKPNPPGDSEIPKTGPWLEKRSTPGIERRVPAPRSEPPAKALPVNAATEKAAFAVPLIPEKPEERAVLSGPASTAPGATPDSAKNGHAAVPVGLSVDGSPIAGGRETASPSNPNRGGEVVPSLGPNDRSRPETKDTAALEISVSKEINAPAGVGIAPPAAPAEGKAPPSTPGPGPAASRLPVEWRTLVQRVDWHWREGKGDVTIALHPREFGRVSVRVETVNDAVTVRFEVDNEAARTGLAHRSEDLTQSLRELGWRVDDVRVALAGAGAGSADSGGRPSADGSPSPFRPPADPRTPSPRREEATRRPSRYLVDLVA